MKLIAPEVRRFLTSEEGPTAVEYAVMLARNRDRLLVGDYQFRHQGQHDVP